MNDSTAGDGVDWVFVVRGASRGFTILLLGGAIQPWIGYLLAPLGYIWLVLVALTAFIVAARPQGGVAGEVRDTMVAAVASYLLVLPLVVHAAGSFPLEQAFFTASTAIAVGAFCGAFHLRNRD